MCHAFGRIPETRRASSPNVGTVASIEPKSAPIDGATHTIATAAPTTRVHTTRARGVRSTVNRHSSAIIAPANTIPYRWLDKP